MATETNHRLLSQQQMILRPLFWGQRTKMLMATMPSPLSHQPAPTRTQTEEARKTQVPPSSEHPHQLGLSLRHRQRAASCLV